MLLFGLLSSTECGGITSGAVLTRSFLANVGLRGSMQ